MAQANPAAAVQNIWNTPELKARIGFTLLCLLVYRIGAHVTAPGIDVQAITQFFDSQGGLLNIYNTFVGGALSRAAIFSLGNRSAAIRVPKYADQEETARFEFRPPDATCNVYLALAAQLMAGIDGVKKRIDPCAAGVRRGRKDAQDPTYERI